VADFRPEDIPAPADALGLQLWAALRHTARTRPDLYPEGIAGLVAASGTPEAFERRATPEQSRALDEVLDGLDQPNDRGEPWPSA
jgi:hypothetical protein